MGTELLIKAKSIVETFNKKVFIATAVLILFTLSYGTFRFFQSKVVVGELKGEAHAKHKKILHISSSILKDYPIQFSSMVEIVPSEEVLLPGHIQRDPTQTAIVTARAQGRVAEVKVKEADDVKAGQILAVIQSTELAQVQTSHLKTFLRYELAERQMERSNELFEHKIVSAKEHELVVMEYESVSAELNASRTSLKNLNFSNYDIKKFEKEKKQLGELLIRSPLNGIVLERKVALGQSVNSEDILFSIGKSDQIWIVLDVYEKDIPLINEGMRAEILVPNSSGQPKVIEAKVARVAQVIDQSTRSAKVWLETKKKDQELLFGQAISARIQGVHQDRENRKIQAVPTDAVHKVEGESIVFVKLGEHEFEPRKIDEGWTSDQWVEIRSGLKPTEVVASKGSFVLKSEFLKN